MSASTRSVRPAGPDFSPLDVELGLTSSRLSPRFHEMVVQTGAVLPFAQAARQIARLTGSVVSAATVRRLTEGAGAAYAAVQEAQIDDPVPPDPVPDILQMSADGAMVRLVGGAWEEVKTVAIGLLPVPLHTETAHAQALSYFSRLADHQTFSRLAVVETDRRGLPHARCVCAVNDGAAWIQQFIDDHRPDAVRILDWAHAVSYLSTVAQAAYGAGTLRATTWLERQQQVLRQGTPEHVLAAVREVLAQRTVQGAEAATVEVIAASLGYLEKRVEQLRYARYRAAGYPIGSGIVESAHQTQVHARLKGAGMFWARAHVNPMLSVRAIEGNDRWAEAWPALTTHLRQQRASAARQRRLTRSRAEPPASPAPTGAPAVCISAPVPADPAPRRAPPSRPPRSRRPAADHPWRHMPLGRPRSA